MAAINKPADSAEPFGAEAQAFRRKLPQLLGRYEGEFVALYVGRVIGHGADDEELAERMYERLGRCAFLYCSGRTPPDRLRPAIARGIC